MKTLRLLPFLLLLYHVNAQEIIFERTTWTEIKAKAKQEKKLIFLDAFTTWCGPCKMLEKTVFKDPAVTEFYNRNFVNARIDMEKSEGLELAKQYSVNCYPNLLFIDGQGVVCHRSVGYMPEKEFLELGKKALSPEQTFSAYEKKYNSGVSDPLFIKEYLDMLGHTCLPTNDVAVKYLSSKPEQELMSEENWMIIFRYVEGVHTKPFLHFISHRKEYAQKFGHDSVNGKISNSYLEEGSNMIYNKKSGPGELDKLKKEIAASEISNGEEISLQLDQMYYEQAGDWNNYYMVSKLLVEKYRSTSSGFLNNVSFKIFEKTNDKTQLQEAENWARRSVEIKEEAYNLDTYACLLNKNGKKQLAIEMEKKAISLAKAAGDDASEYEKTLKGFEKGK